ncbi:hypothetical protein CVFO_0270 [Isorropodon fossajaponicum endosymbiont JTNG4]|nr:hypothetical protein CVFO_0270 [Isorropodon fossajaponicum endosymbiont JTNG4]
MIIATLSAPWFDTSFYNYFFIKTYVISFAVFVVILWLIYRDSNQVFEFGLVSISLLALFLLGIISLAYGVNLDFSISKLLLWLIVFFAFMLVRTINSQPKILNFTALSLVSSSVLIALIGVSQHLFSYPMLQGSINPAATFGNKNLC